MPNQEIKLKVMEAVQDDVNKGLVKIDSSFMRQLGVNPGDIVEVRGERITAAIVDRSYPGDIGLNIIRMDGNTRKNAKTSIGELVFVKKTEAHSAKKVVIAPVNKGVMIRAHPNLFKQGLLGKALVKGDLVALRRTGRRRMGFVDPGRDIDDVFSALENQFAGFGFGNLHFRVIDTNPKKEIVVVTDETEVEFNPQAVEISEAEEAAPGINYEDIGGLGDEIKKIREMVELPLKHPEIFERLGIEPPKGLLLHGPPGTGKTLLARAVASETNSHFIVINGPEIMSKWYGESEANLRKKFEDAEQNAPSIIFFDEIDAIATKREETRGEVEKRVVAQLLGLMDGMKSRGKVIVIAATNMPNSLDPALRRPGRFDREIEVNVPDKQGRLDILKIHTRNMPMDKNINLKEIANVTHGFVGADLNALAKEAAMIVLRRILPDLKMDGKEDEQPIPKEVLEKLMITQHDFTEALKIVRPSAMREVLVETPDVNWTDIGGMEEIKDKLKEAVEWPLKHPELFKKMGIRPPRGILLYGPPGTGKTLLAKAVAKESESNFILVNGPSLLSKWVGESEKAVREIFRKARQTAPTILFFDEIDALVPRRGSSQGEGNRSSDKIVNQVLTEMDGLESLNDVLVIAATNRPDIVDPALLRQGRFDRMIYTSIPDVDGRKKIFEVHLKEMAVDYSSVDNDELKDAVKVEKPKSKKAKVVPELAVQTELPASNTAVEQTSSGTPEQISKFTQLLAEKTEKYVGADIEGVCREAGMLALRESIDANILKKVTFSHVIKALSLVKGSVDEDVEKAYKELENYFSSARAKQIKEKPNKDSYFG